MSPRPPAPKLSNWETPNFAIWEVRELLFPWDQGKGLRVTRSPQLLTSRADSRMFSTETDGC